MCPKEAKIFFLDNDSDYAETEIEKLIAAGHSVPLSAYSRKEAEELIPLFDAHKINVAILDKRLVANDEHNVDGEHIGELIRQAHPEVIIVGNSSQGLNCAHVNNHAKGRNSNLDKDYKGV